MGRKRDYDALTSDDIQWLRALQPSTTVDIQITTPTSPKRVKTQYIGMDAPHGILFQVPNSPSWKFTRDLLTPGNNIVVRYVLEGGVGHVIAFRVKVIKLITKPFGILITTFPKSLQTFGLREEKRAQPGIAVDIQTAKPQGDTKIHGIIVDVSSKGCRVALAIHPDYPLFEPEENITLQYESGGKPISIEGKVKNKNSDREHHYYGIRFAENQSTVHKLLEKHILIEQ
ncbi:flagellar brake protein [Alteromonas sp. ASW11-130]|uniref:flagellar brake protein n=1 Tax=Alteromonas sp. ASW11-130 TaxID=3015775 RepID=UPI002241F831|nr:flagellar brake protein [Alteromonas sp. ASW11-130]MCW8092227.1 flagellar brake protein [Alteromonas sp. ASW11-130]